uniref:Large ribosomal subunit protein bL32m n=1 Tax=Arion vulgaris TaxID=1028688 RepID=A0A0B6Z9J0_9EUPU
MASFIRTFVLTFSHKWNISMNNLQLLANILSRKGPPPAFAIAACPSLMPTQSSNSSPPQSGLDSIFDGILLAVPKFRRSLEKRLFRKHNFCGFMEHAEKKKNIIPCLECGHFREKGHLCENCYNNVRQETKEMQAKMGDDLLFNVPRSEVEFVYEGEKEVGDKYTVKMEKPRPSWFPKQLLNKTG